MTYKLEPGLGRIVSPVTLLFPDGTTASFSSDKELCKMAFDRNYKVTEIRAVEDVVEIRLETVAVPDINPIGR